MSCLYDVMSRWLAAVGILLLLAAAVTLQARADMPTPVNCVLCDASCFLDKTPPNCSSGKCKSTTECLPCKCKTQHFETNFWCECQLAQEAP